MTNPTDTPLLQFAACAPCAFTWLRRDEQLNCPMCAQPPTGVVRFSSLSGDAPPAAGTPPADAAAGEELVTTFGGTCPHCDQLVNIVITDTSITLEKTQPEPEAAHSSDNEVLREASSGNGQTASDEGGAPAVLPGATGLAADASSSEPDPVPAS